MELLSPAGSFQSFLQAVEYGADAVYLGLKHFNARKPASNFSLKEYEEAGEIAKKHGVKIYITLNIDLKPGEFEKLFKLLEYLSNVGVDGVIVKDFGVIDILKRFFPSIEFHLSTQFGVSNSFGVKAAKNLGATRVILARELNYREIEKTTREDMEVEIFAQGSMCFSFSGRCLLSSWVGGKSANRGGCQAPCRLKYSSNSGSKPFFSMKDLNLIDSINYLKTLNIACLKIEGRLKNPKWVGDVTKIYRDTIDGKSSVEDQERLKLYSGREQSTGFVEELTNLTAENKQEFGKFIGVIESVDDDKIILDRDFGEIRDSLRVTFNGDFKGIIYKSVVDGRSIESEKEFPVGSKVYEVVIASESKKTISDYKFNIFFKIDDSKISTSVETKFGSFEFDTKVKKVVKQSRGIYLSSIEDTLLKGVTGYRVEEFDMDDDILVAKSQINNLVKDLTSKLALHIKRNRDSLPKLDDRIYNFLNKVEDGEDSITISRKNFNTFRVFPHQLNGLSCDVNRIIIDRFDEDIKGVNRFAESFDGEVVISIFPILFEKDYIEIREALKRLSDKIKVLEINDISQLSLAGERFTLVGGIGIAPFNQFGVNYLKSLGLRSVHLSQELDKGSLEAISEHCNGLDYTIYSKIPLFYSRAEIDGSKGNLYEDSIGTKMVTSEYRSITIYESENEFVSEGVDLSGVKVRNLIVDLRYCSSIPSTLKKIREGKVKNSSNFNLIKGLS